VEVSGEVQYHSERIPDPERLFFDLEGVKPRTGSSRIEVIPVGDRLVRQIRVAETRPGTTRVVLDLAAPVEFAASHLSNPDRLMIELRLTAQPPPPTQPIATAAPEPAATPPASPPTTHNPQPTTSAPEKPAPAAPKADAQAAKRDSRGGRSLIRALGLKLERVVLDPGHGGHDTGTIGPGGLSEKELVLDVAKRLGALIGERLGSQVIYTRTDDSFVSLESRTELANQNKADLFLSIHANSSGLRGLAGSETYYLNFTTSRSALEVASRENATSQKSIYELQELIEKIALKEKVQESREFASTVQKALYASLWRGKSGMKDRGVKKAPFVVLIGATMPSVLAEIDFLSNPREEKLLSRPEHRQRVAEALFKGVSQYADTLSHFQVAQKN
jgi:N-acetylmuramoyl-L-alanine amidase